MRNRLLILLGMALVAMTSFAQTWTEPEPMDPDTEPSALASEHVYKVRNVESQKYLGGGKAWFDWSTTAVLKELEEDGINFLLTQEEKGWTLKNYGGTWNGKYLFVSGNGKEGYAMHVDNASDQHRYFEIIAQGDNKYRIRVAEADDTYGKSKTTDWEEKFLCWDKADDAAENGAIQAALVPDDENTFAEFEFIDQNQHLLIVKTELYNLAKAIVDEELDVDYEAYTDVYNGSDYEAIKAAIAALQKQYDLAKVYKVLSVGEDGVNPPSDDNPCDATPLIKNASFDAGNISGWTCTFVSGQNANNVGYQSASHANEDGTIKVEKFIEAWANSSSRFNPNLNFSAIGDGKLSQTMSALPQGKYKFTCDAISVQQHQTSENPVTGVELFAIGGELPQTKAIATKITPRNDLPEHFEVLFISTGGDVEIGLRTNNATANWIAADNFTLTYYGEVTGDPDQIILNTYIAELEKKYGDLSTVKANADIKTTYTTKLAAAKEAVEDFKAIKADLEAIVANLEESIAFYASFAEQLDAFIAKVQDNAEEWPGMGTYVMDVYQEARTSYENGTATSESIADFANKSSKAIADYISENVTPGKDVTILLNNPGFDKDQSGWEITNYDGTGKVEAGNHRWGGENVILPAGFVKEGGVEVAEQETLVSGCNEIWKGAFKYQQTIYNMPAGVYTLSCKGFQRNENNQSDVSVPEGAAELFAIVGEDLQTQKFANIFGDCSDFMLYNGASAGDEGVAYGGGVGTEQDKNEAGPANGMYYPNGMCGASAHFAAGYYKQEFDIVVAETSNIVVGARCKANYYWTLFDDFQIVYKGKDARQLDKTIDDLTSQIENAQVNESDIVLTKDVKTVADAAIATGVEAKGDNDYDKSSAAVKALREALAEVQNTMIFVTEFYNEYAEMADWRFDLSDYYGDDLSFNGTPEILDVIREKLTSAENAFADTTEIKTYRLNMKKAYTAAVMEGASVGSADEASPADVTAAIYNPNNMSYDIDDETSDYYAIGAKGWNVSKGTVGYGNSGNKATEFFQQAFDINQTIYNLTPGFYRLKVNGFYRDGNAARIDSCLNKKEGFDNLSYAYLYAGDKETTMLRITNEEDFNRWTEFIVDDAGIENISEASSGKIVLKADNLDELEDDETMYIPNTALAAYTAFNLNYEDDSEDPMWLNILQFEVKEGETDVTIGIRKEHDLNVKADAEAGIEAFEYGDWTVFTNWRLEYVGTEEPSNDPTTTTIKGIENTVAPAKAVIYNIAGQRVAKAVKGLYIINGKKVVVK